MSMRIATANGKGHCWLCRNRIPKGATQLIVVDITNSFEHRVCVSCSIEMLEKEINERQMLLERLMEVVDEL